MELPKPVESIFYFSGTLVHRAEEEYMRDHVLCHITEGTLSMQDADGENIYGKGTTLLIRKNHLVKCEKRPPVTGGRYQMLFILLGGELLQEYIVSEQLPEPIPGTLAPDPVLVLAPKPALEGLLQSLISYHKNNYAPGPALLNSKLKETIHALLEQGDHLFTWLFKKEKYVKPDLATFMERNFRFNIPISKFAELSGRSISTFQRDFLDIYGMKATTWLRKRRLQAAYQLLQHNSKASDIYLSLGFEDLAHFSRSFKQEFNILPSQVSGKHFLRDKP
ncbi:helix-turn-helix transcriptional regulator [Chitinophaga agrisoli]|uniref:Helix-turn-helix transcriptional regulator n=1 Tax=Chitinophaga agrisoli TaxID=2607653 RepID=A0A5B2VNS9_9BACT|nr:AraC family transcriptional regulator [Chitinophaga agrisoli]KAA2239799.1 helix-turn-helix transcriptional regulator [Chitinophaga agrisoli]